MTFETVNNPTDTISKDFRLKRRVVNDRGMAVRTTVAAHTDTRKPICDVLTLRSADIDGNMPVGKNSDVTVAKTVNPIAVIAAHGKRSVDAEVVVILLTA
jgi:hypothetical protein